MALTRRIGTEGSPTRATLLDAAAALMREEGYEHHLAQVEGPRPHTGDL